MQPIYLPEQVDIEEVDKNTTTFSIHPYFPGYGPTAGNALRRTLLSSLPGAAITHMKIEGLDHEYTAIKGIKEDAVTIMLKLKQVKLSCTTDEPVEIVLKASGKTKVTANDFETPPEVTVANTDLVIANLTDKEAELEIRCTVEQGRGYVSSENRNDEQRDIGTIALDAVFTPVERVSFEVKNVRVGQDTNYHKLIITITTDGTIKPIEALKQSASILSDHFAELAGDFEEKLTADRPEDIPEPIAEDEEPEPENTLSLLKLPSRVHNALERIGITTVEQVTELDDDQIRDIPGLGEKAVDDIKKSRDNYIATHKETSDEA